MLKIVRSKHPASGREAFCSEITRLVGEGRRACLIVPEQQTVMAEGMMSKILPPSSALSFEVTNFTRLANTTFRSLGGLSGEYCDGTKKALIMWRTLTELSTTLTMTSGRRDITSGLVESALSAVGQMQSFGIHPADLADMCENDEIKSDNRLYTKINDLASIFALYKKLVGERYADPGDDAEAMINKLNEYPDFLSDTSLFIEGFTSFTEPQYKLISLLAVRTNISVSLTLPKGMEEAFEYSEIVDCESRLISGARKFGADVKRVREEGYGKKRNQSLDDICARLWLSSDKNDKISLQNSEDLRIFQAHTPYDECEFVCQDIKRRVMDGESYSDFAIVSRNAEDYQGILDGALSRAKIPAFTSSRRDTNEFEAIKLIYTAYAVARGFRREDVISYAKCSLSGISRDECDEFEMYVNKWQITGRRFTDGVLWNMNPLGFTTHRDLSSDEKLVRIHNVREKIIGPLSSFSSKIYSASTVREQAEVLLDFLTGIEMEASLKERSKKLLALGEGALSEGNAVLWRVICQALDTLVTVLGDTPCDAETFLSQLKVVFSATDIGRIPAYIDQVVVGSADMLRLYEKKHIYLIGVNAGKFPANLSDKSYFSDRDKIKLNRCGLSITPELEIKGARELYIFSRAFSYATDSVTISYCSTDTRFKTIDPSEVISKILSLTGGEVKPLRIQTLPPSRRIFTPESALSGLGEHIESYEPIRDALVESGFEGVVEVCESSISNEINRLESQIVPTDKPIRLSQSSIDEYVKCPFGYFCKYVLHLESDDVAEFDARNIGTFIHSILENLFKTIYDQQISPGDLTKEERARLTREAAQRHLSELGDDMLNVSNKTKVKIDRLCRAALPVVDGLCDEFSKSKFIPRFFELNLDYKNPSTPDPIRIKADSGDISISGKIDRVDVFRDDKNVYLRVIDYKTGSKVFSAKDIYEGKNLQMFLYLKALVESEKESFLHELGVPEDGRILPAGVIYVKTSVRDQKVLTPSDEDAMQAIKESQIRDGMMLDDDRVLEAMTLKYSPVYSSKTPDKVTDANRKNYMYDEDRWKEIMNTVEGAVCRVADGIRGGEMDADPNGKGSNSPCVYCNFRSVCRK